MPSHNSPAAQCGAAAKPAKLHLPQERLVPIKSVAVKSFRIRSKGRTMHHLSPLWDYNLGTFGNAATVHGRISGGFTKATTRSGEA